MTLGSFVVRNTFRNKRRSLLTMISISFSLLLLTLMICIWRSFYVDQVAPEASRRLIVRDRVSLAFFLPAFYREKIRAVAGVTSVRRSTWFGGRYIDDRPEHFFAQMGTDPDEYLKVASDKIVPADQVKAWQQDRAGALVDVTLAKKYGWKIGDRDYFAGEYFPDEPGSDDSRHLSPRSSSECAVLQLPSTWKRLCRGSKGRRAGTPRRSIRRTMYRAPRGRLMTCSATRRCRPRPRARRAFQLGFVASLGNIKAFILGICGAVVFTIMLVSANTMAMSVRSRTREVAVLKTLGFTRQRVLSIFVSEVCGSGGCGRSAWSLDSDSRDRFPDAQFHWVGHTARI